jgi:hypothetical protein
MSATEDQKGRNVFLGAKYIYIERDHKREEMSQNDIKILL